MANTIKLKRASGSDPSASDLVVGEVALRTDTAKLFTKKDDNSVAEIGGGISDVVDDTSPQLGGNLDTNDKNIVFADSDGGSGTDNRAVFGASSDLQIYHDGGGSKITHANTGDLVINNTSGDTWLGTNGTLRVSNASNNGYMAKFVENGTTELYYDGSKKFQTTSAGCGVTGDLTFADDGKAIFGAGDDLQIFHNGSHSRFLDNGTGKLQFGSDTGVEILTGNFATQIALFDSSQILLKENTSVTGNITVSGTVDGRDVATDGTKLDGIAASAIANLVEDTSPQLGGDLDVQSSKITTATSNGNVKIEPDGTGVVEVRGAGGNDGKLQLNCSAQSHGIILASPAHSAGQSYTLIFPDNQIAADKYLKIKSISGSGSTAIGQAEYASLDANDLGEGTVPDARFPSTLPALNGSALTNLNGSNIASGTVAAARVATLNQDTTGNAATATALETARTIAGVSFDGTANISLNNNAITNGAGYITATLTNEQVQDIVGGMLTGNTETGITVTYQDGDGTIDFVVGTLNQDTTGNAATATALETARNIGGVSFDGTANINLPGVNTAGNQNTTGTSGGFTAGSASNLNSGTLPDARFPSTLPAVDGSNLTGISAGATGGGSDEIFYENGQTVTTDYTITNGKNAMSAGPITINSGVTVTVGSGETLTIV